MRLANRRFVPFYFDLATRGFAGDADARNFVVAKKPELGGRQVPTPPVLLMTPGGEVLGEVSNYAPAADVLRAMEKALEERPEFNEPGEEEAGATDPVERAGILIDLLDYEGARRALERRPEPRARYLLGRLARLAGDFDAMEAAFAGVGKGELDDDMRMERAYRFWQEKEYEGLRDHLKGFPEGARFSEARYYEGLALFHLGKKEDALAVWKSAIRACPEDPWIYRCDWAYCNGRESGGRRSFSSAGKRVSLLNRIGYMGRRNPDLER